MARDLTRLPRAEPHLHFVGSMSPATLAELADRHGVRLPAGLLDSRQPAEAPGPRGWARFQRLYDAARTVVRTAADVHRVVLEAVRAEAAGGTGWVELQVTPSGYTAALGGLIPAMEVFVGAARAAERASGVGVGLVVAANRTRHPQEAATLARLAARWAGDGVVGFGLSNDERAAPARDFAQAFRIAAAAGLLLTPHAGELRGPVEVADAVEVLRPHRLGHGVRAAEDPALLARLAEAGVACEVCPASNVALGVYPGHDQVPLRTLLDAGVPVVLGADDPLLSGADLTDQYTAARDVHGLGDEALAALARSSVRHTAAPADVRARLLRGIDHWLEGDGH